MNPLIGVVVGSVLTLISQTFWKRLERASMCRAVAAALWEELSAVRFYEEGGARKFAGFSSQVFDSQFREIGLSLPPELARQVMRYHWRMKYLTGTRNEFNVGDQEFTTWAENQRAWLLDELDRLAQQSVGDIALTRDEDYRIAPPR